jgi:hypothetical protein
MSLVFFVAKLNQNAICFWGLATSTKGVFELKKQSPEKAVYLDWVRQI